MNNVEKCEYQNAVQSNELECENLGWAAVVVFDGQVVAEPQASTQDLADAMAPLGEGDENEH